MIYSFDGGTKATYEKMRPGRSGKITLMIFIEIYPIFQKLKKSLTHLFLEQKFK